MHRQIEGYASRVSVRPGQRFDLHVSTSAGRFRVVAYRFGQYRGGWAHAVWRSRWLDGHEQSRPRFRPYATRTIVAPWRRSVRVRTEGWRPGAYLLKLVARSGWQAHVPLIVRSRSAAGKVAIVAPVTTWQAYNDWGGYSLYVGRGGDRRAWAVSYDRPYPRPGAGPGSMMYGVLPTVVLAERLDVRLAYFTNVDLHERRRTLAKARGYVGVGHDEYWTRAMRRHVTRARAHGTNLAFLGANTMYWRIRLEDRRTGPNRLQVGWRHDAALDPRARDRPGLSTARWRDQPRPRPEDRLIGMLYECFPVNADYRVVSPRWWGFRGTGVNRGTRFPDLVGVEADRVYPVRSTPRPLQILSHVDYSCGGVGTSAQSVYYTTPSGAGVFAAGTLRWQCAMMRHCGQGRMPVRNRVFVKRVTRNVVTQFAAGPVGDRFRARDNLRRFDLPRFNQVPAS
jgi:hypothetical protein